MQTDHRDRAPVVETQLVHDVHRRAAALLADALGQASVDDDVMELRDFVVVTLRHHHQSEDADLWPIVIGAAPNLADTLRVLSDEHERLDERLDVLQGVSIEDANRGRAREPAIEVREQVYEHLAHEEPILFPALGQHVTDRAWAGFSARTVTTAPSVGTHLLVALLDEVGTSEEVDLIFRHLPPEAREQLPSIRTEGVAALGRLRTAEQSSLSRARR